MLKSLHQFLVITLLAATVGGFTGWCPEDCYGETQSSSEQSHEHSLPNADSHPCDDCCPCPCNISFFCEEYVFTFDLPEQPLVFYSDVTASLLDEPQLPLVQPPRQVS